MNVMTKEPIIKANNLYTLPELGYSYDALEPHIDAKTMEIHHTKHHQAYINNLKGALEKHSDYKPGSLDEIISDLSRVPEDIRTAVRNNGGGHYNHSFFWPLLKTGVAFEGDIADAIKAKYGSYEEFQKKFSTAAAGQFGSGWGWLVVSGGELEIMSTANQDNPLSQGKMPVLGVDVWEHAYYLKYQNRRPDYLQAFFNIINWQKVNEHFLKAVK